MRLSTQNINNLKIAYNFDTKEYFKHCIISNENMANLVGPSITLSVNINIL